MAYSVTPTVDEDIAFWLTVPPDSVAGGMLVHQLIARIWQEQARARASADALGVIQDVIAANPGKTMDTDWLMRHCRNAIVASDAVAIAGRATNG